MLEEIGQKMYEKLKEGLSKQLNEYVIVEKSDYFVLNNFMDGTNGVFAYNSNTGKGVDSYEASGSIITAWWPQLDDDYINKLYEGYYNFIMNTDILPKEFEDSLTTRERNTKMINIRWYRIILYCATNMQNTSR